MKILKLFLILVCVSTAYADDHWRVEVKSENYIDVVRVYDSPESKNLLLVIKAEARSQGFISADEIFIRSVNKKFLLTRWILGATGSETIKIFDPAMMSKKEIYKLQSMPSEFKINSNGITFIIPTGPGTYSATDWIAK